MEIVLRHQPAAPAPLNTRLAGDLVESLEPPREPLPPPLDAPWASLTEVTSTDRPSGLRDSQQSTSTNGAMKYFYLHTANQTLTNFAHRVKVHPPFCVTAACVLSTFCFKDLL